MSALLSPLPIMQFFTAAGVPLSGGKLYTYAAGTSTPQATYTDSTGNTANTNPVILNSRGEANVWISTSQYKYVLKDSTDTLIWTVDNISTSSGSGGGGAAGGGADEVFFENQLIVTTSYTLSTNKSAMSVGPVTINAGAVVTVPGGYRWIIF
jgi:hypothetical protein